MAPFWLDLGGPCFRQRRWPEDVDREEVVPFLAQRVDDQPVEELGDVRQRVAQRGGGPKARGRRVAAKECEQGGVHTWRAEDAAVVAGALVLLAINRSARLPIS